MRRLSCINAVTGFAYTLLGILAHARPEFLCLLLLLAALLALVVQLFVDLFLGIRAWRRESRLWWIPMVICAVFLSAGWFLAPPIGRAIADWKFRKHVAELNVIVNGISDGSIQCEGPCVTAFAPLDLATPPRNIRAIFAERCDPRTVIVAFLLKTDVPLLHEGYFYKSSGADDHCAKEGSWEKEKYLYERSLTGDWHHFSDEPGL